ncbi:hypothetical protein C8Q73DRAFT_674952 [Cubamyces lactineus]|nr:hypothetical protein C8Q73DRAFT_674952 [Cubamyces lactineus]
MSNPSDERSLSRGQSVPMPLPDDVFILIAFELKRADFDGLLMMSRASWRIRLLCLPTLFECSYIRNTSKSGFQIPPEQVRPYVRRLTLFGADVSHCDTPIELLYKIHLPLLPNLSRLHFKQTSFGISPRLMDVCLDKVTSLDIDYPARWRSTSQMDQTPAYTSRNLLRHFSLKTHCFRELLSRLRRYDLVAEYAVESRYLAQLVCGMHTTAESLSLPMETAPLSRMSELSWPRIRTLALYGRYLTPGQPALLQSVLTRMPSLRSLRVQVAQLPALSRPWILNPHVSLDFAELRSLTVAYPDPDDIIFSMKTPCLTHLSLRDEPRYYFYRRNRGFLPSSAVAPILGASDCLAILRKMDVPLLSSLELVYKVDVGEYELLHHISTSYPNLAQLEVHRYRANDTDIVPYTSITSTLSKIRSLQALYLNLDWALTPPVHCKDDEMIGAWVIFIRERAQEVLSILQSSPRFEYVAFLHPQLQCCTWVEFRPSWYPGKQIDADIFELKRRDSDSAPYV